MNTNRLEKYFAGMRERVDKLTAPRAETNDPQTWTLAQLRVCDAQVTHEQTLLHIAKSALAMLSTIRGEPISDEALEWFDRETAVLDEVARQVAEAIAAKE